MKHIPRRVFTEEFKQEAARLVQSEGLTVVKANRNLDVAPKSIRTWISQYQQGTHRWRITIQAAIVINLRSVNLVFWPTCER